MKREIRFRAWDKLYRKMFIGEEKFTGDFDDHHELYGTRWNLFLDALQDVNFDGEDGFVLMQYTGLRDKNGKEIYEGDIVKQYSTIKEVKWNDGKMGWNIVRTWRKEAKSGGHLEVIGNIYENPDLLTKQSSGTINKPSI